MILPKMTFINYYFSKVRISFRSCETSIAVITTKSIFNTQAQMPDALSWAIWHSLLAKAGSGGDTFQMHQKQFFL